MNHTRFFKENATQPTAWSVGKGSHVEFSVTKEIFTRDEPELKKLAQQYKLKTKKNGNLVTFYKD